VRTSLVEACTPRAFRFRARGGGRVADHQTVGLVQQNAGEGDPAVVFAEGTHRGPSPRHPSFEALTRLAGSAPSEHTAPLGAGLVVPSIAALSLPGYGHPAPPGPAERH